LQCLRAWDITPVIIGTPEERAYYPGNDDCIDKRSYDLQEQMSLLRGADCVIAADSWHKTFSAMASIDTVVFESNFGHDLDHNPDVSNHVFITPWKEITFVRRFDHAIRTIATRLGKDLARVKDIVGSVREPLRASTMPPFSLRDRIFNSYSFATARSVLVRTDDVLRDTLVAANVIRRLKKLHPHLHVTVSATEQGMELFRDVTGMDACVRKGSAEEFRAESTADEIVEYSFIVDQVSEHYTGAHHMDVMAGIA
ncbi:MAG: hypothetical protein ACKOB6_02730, partial [Candidatus Kapaibacterium sp.]